MSQKLESPTMLKIVGDNLEPDDSKIEFMTPDDIIYLPTEFPLTCHEPI